MATPTVSGTIDHTTQGCTNSYPLPTMDTSSYLVYHQPDGFCQAVDPFTMQVLSPPWYGYTPGLAAGGVFVAFFGTLLIAHFFLWAKSKRLWLIVLPIGAIGEVLGWGGRLASAISNNYGPEGYNAFLINIVCLTITPAFFSGAAYGIFVLLVNHIGSAWSRFRPRILVWIFVSMDIFSLVIQAAGGGVAASAQPGSALQNTGTNIFVAGIAFQLASMLVFSSLTLEYLYKVHRQRDVWDAIPRRVKLLYLANLTASALIVVRAIYRTAELAEGWEGYIITHEGYFLGFDAACMLACLFTFAVGHPAHLLPKSLPPLHEETKEGPAMHEEPASSNASDVVREVKT